jgi:uncharacterized membrane protein YhaH (DUF805 family)
VNFGQSIRNVLSQYVGFRGRARRSEYWYFELFAFLGLIGIGIVEAFIGTRVISTVFELALILPQLSVGARRLHDIDRSGWWQLLLLIPLVGFIVLVFWACQDSDADNRHGPSPKYPDQLLPGRHA